MRDVTPQELQRIGETLARETREAELERERVRLESELAARLEYEELDPLYVRRDREADAR